MDLRSFGLGILGGLFVFWRSEAQLWSPCEFRNSGFDALGFEDSGFGALGTV